MKNYTININSINLYALCLDKDQRPCIKLFLTSYKFRKQLVEILNYDIRNIEQKYKNTNYIDRYQKIVFNFSDLLEKAFKNEISLLYFNHNVNITHTILAYFFGSHEQDIIFVFKKPINNNLIFHSHNYLYTFSTPIFNKIINNNFINMNQESLIYIKGNELIYKDNNEAKQLLKFITKT